MARVDHIGIAVKNAEASCRFYTEVLGFQVAGTRSTGAMKLLFIKAGNTEIELLEPEAGQVSAVSKFLESRGEGLHHVAFQVDDIEAALAGAKAAGYDLIDEKSRPGGGGDRIAFVHPKGNSGVLVEYVEKAR